MAPVLPLRTAWIADILSQASLRDVERQRYWKRGSGDGQRFWDYFTARLSDLSMPLTSEVRHSPEPSARPSAAADSEERQICTTCLVAESVGLCLCFLPSCAMYKDNAVANVVAETGRDLVFMITARLSDLSMPLKGEVRRSPEQSARQPIARSGKFVRTVLCFLPTCSTLLFERGLGLGEEGRFDVPSRSETPKTSCQNHKQQLLRPRSGPSKAAHGKQHIPEKPRWKNSKYWANIEKRNQINTKNYWNNLRKFCKLQSTNQYKCAEWMTLICALRFADFLRLCLSPRTTSRTISFSISNSF